MRVDRPYWVCRRFRSTFSGKWYNEVWLATQSWWKAMNTARELYNAKKGEYFVVMDNTHHRPIARFGAPSRKGHLT